MAVKQTEIKTLKVGGFVVIDGVACRIKDIQTSKTGKHGHAKCRIEAIGLINNIKKIIIKPGHEKLDVPIIEKKAAQVLSLHENIANVMDMETYETFDLKIPEELQGQVIEGGQVVYWKILEDKILMQTK